MFLVIPDTTIRAEVRTSYYSGLNEDTSVLLLNYYFLILIGKELVIEDSKTPSPFIT